MQLSYSSSALKKNFSSLNPDKDWSFKETGRSATNYISHGYHRYPAKFIPQIVKELLDAYTQENDLVVDPFGGCGTTLVESKIKGRKSYGFDINPVAKLITDVKTTPIPPLTLTKYYEVFLNHYAHTSKKLHRNETDRINYWFSESSQAELNRIYTAIKSIKNYSVRKFYICAFSHILKNSSKWLMKSIKPQVDKNKKEVDIFKVFNNHLLFMTKRNEQFYSLLSNKQFLKIPAKMRVANSMKRLPLESSSVDIIITSPPYVTSYEYADLHQLSLLWLGNDKENFKAWGKHVNDFRGFRKKFIGTSFKKNARPSLNSFIAEDLVLRLLLKDKSISNSVAAYFSDMNKSFGEMYRILKPGSKACIILGNTTLLGIEILNAEVAAEQMQEAGFIVNKLIKREVSNKMITPWRDKVNGKFTSKSSSHKIRAYEYEFIIIAEKPLVLSN